MAGPRRFLAVGNFRETQYERSRRPILIVVGEHEGRKLSVGYCRGEVSFFSFGLDDPNFICETSFNLSCDGHLSDLRFCCCGTRICYIIRLIFYPRLRQQQHFFSDFFSIYSHPYSFINDLPSILASQTSTVPSCTRDFYPSLPNPQLPSLGCNLYPALSSRYPPSVATRTPTVCSMQQGYLLPGCISDICLLLFLSLPDADAAATSTSGDPPPNVGVSMAEHWRHKQVAAGRPVR